ncbi:MAG TPA: DNA alkylation repair protein [Candidatus Babeliales bacterium]|nr:DNA alkylation repair protein [Candidatus Babeliales bacterium]
MAPQNIIVELHTNLSKHIDPEYREQARRFSKEEIRLLGVRVPVVRRISAAHFSEIKNLDKKEVFQICEQLLKKEQEFQTIAFDWLNKIRKKFEPSDFEFFQHCLENYVSNWAACDDFCTHALGFFLYKFPQFLPQLKSWANSENRWMRRASAVSLIYSLRKDFYLEDAFGLAQILLEDKDDLVQKGYGWMLKEATKTQQTDIFNFVMNHKAKMPRTALRYAIEKLPASMKQEAMK